MGILDIDNTVREIIKGGKQTISVPKPSYPNKSLLGNLPSDTQIVNLIKNALGKVPHIEMAWGEVTVKLKGVEPKKITFKVQ